MNPLRIKQVKVVQMLGKRAYQIAFSWLLWWPFKPWFQDPCEPVVSKNSKVKMSGSEHIRNTASKFIRHSQAWLHNLRDSVQNKNVGSSSTLNKSRVLCDFTGHIYETRCWCIASWKEGKSYICSAELFPPPGLQPKSTSALIGHALRDLLPGPCLCGFISLWHGMNSLAPRCCYPLTIPVFLIIEASIFLCPICYCLREKRCEVHRACSAFHDMICVSASKTFSNEPSALSCSPLLPPLPQSLLRWEKEKGHPSVRWQHLWKMRGSPHGSHQTQNSHVLCHRHCSFPSKSDYGWKTGNT